MTDPSLTLAVADGTLALSGATDHRAVRPWCPRPHPHDSRAPRAEPAVVLALAESDGEPPPPPSVPRTLRWGAVHGWMAGDTLRLVGPQVWGEGRLASGRGEVTLRRNAPPEALADDVAAALLLSAGVLLGAQGHLLLHAGAVVDGAGRAWLLAGDTHSGKSTTVATLSGAGVRWVCDDTLLVRAGAEGLEVRGWVRRPHLDAGYGDGRVLGRRVEAEPGDSGPFAHATWTPVAPLGGVLLPAVRAGEGTRVERVAAAEAFGVLVRQGPWAGALPSAHAERLLALLSAVASLPAHRLWLGRDSYGNVRVLRDALARGMGWS